MALDVNHPTMMEKPIEDCRDDHRISKELLPVAEALVGGDNGRASFIAIRDNLEEQIGLMLCYLRPQPITTI